MKLLFLFCALLMNFVSYADFREIECSHPLQRDFYLNLRPTFINSSIYDVDMRYLDEEGQTQSKRFHAHSRRTGRFHQVSLWAGARFQLDINIWPDHRPRTFREYRSELRYSPQIGQSNQIDLRCEFYGFGW